MVKTQSSSQPEEMPEAEPGQGSKLPNQSPRSTPSNHSEDKLQSYSKPEWFRGSRFIGGHTSLPLSHSSGHLDSWAQLEENNGAYGSSLVDGYNICDSPEVGCRSLVKAYSSLCLMVPQTPESLLPVDPQTDSLASECSSEGSISSDSFSPDLMSDNNPKCQHHLSHYDHHYGSPYGHAAGRVSSGMGQHSPCGYSVTQRLQKQQGSVLEEHSSVSSHTPPRQHKAATVNIVPHHQRLGNYHGEQPPRLPQTSIAHPHSQNSSFSPNLLTSWEGDLQDSTIYKGSPLNSRRNCSGSTQHPQHRTHWDSNHESPSRPCYDLFSYKSFPPLHGKGWHSHWGQQPPSSHHGLSASSAPPPLQQSLRSITTQRNHLQNERHYSGHLSSGQYQDLRERVFLNLCAIFPPDLVRKVMTKNPHMSDAQELAASILMEKLQHVS